MIHGRGGTGKTTFGASAKNPIFLCCEDGRGMLDVDDFKFDEKGRTKPDDYVEVMRGINELVNDEHDFGTLVIDTVDAFEPLIWAETCKRNSGKATIGHIEDFGYQKGYTYADGVWTEFFHALDDLRARRRMMIIVLSHCDIQRVQDPQVGSYDRITPKLHKRANELLYSWADIVGYLAIDNMAVKTGEGKHETNTARNTGQRILHLEDRGGIAAKNRYDLPPQINLPKKNSFPALRNAISVSYKAQKAMTPAEPEAQAAVGDAA